jgi:hypothetical protein
MERRLQHWLMLISNCLGLILVLHFREPKTADSMIQSETWGAYRLQTYSKMMALVANRLPHFECSAIPANPHWHQMLESTEHQDLIEAKDSYSMEKIVGTFDFAVAVAFATFACASSVGAFLPTLLGFARFRHSNRAMWQLKQTHEIKSEQQSKLENQIEDKCQAQKRMMLAS